MKYLVKTDCLEWHHVNVIIEADSEEEARELAEEMEGDIYSDAYCTTEQIDVKEVEPYEFLSKEMDAADKGESNIEDES